MAKTTSSPNRRRTVKRARNRRPTTPAAPAAVPKIRVRMYRQGLGDCFLVTFDVGGSEKHMLIDCGTLGATTTGVKLAQVVANVRTTTNDHLDVLIATHEHWDHVAGFDARLQPEFTKMTIDRVWLAWTEDPADPLAREVQKHKDDLGAALLEVLRALTAPAASPASMALGAAIASILGFFDDDALAAGKFSTTVNDAMAFVRSGTGATTRYCKPGDGYIEEPWLPGFRIFVLGPPRDEKALADLGGHGSSELYSLAARLKTAARQLISGKDPLVRVSDDGESDDRAAFVADLPFDSRFRRDAASMATREMFANTYFAEGADWRRVDEDWLHAAADLALQLDSATNNTSLALAIERIADGKVLLFPADAQQGNWLSWHDAALQWTVGEGTAASTVRATDLLARTVFYKVGHHGSHNATAKPKGLELMQQSSEVTAFVPVDRAVALGRHPKGSWKMPALALYRRLLEQCNGRVLRSDIGWAANATTAANKPVEKAFVDVATAEEWAGWEAAQQAAPVVIDPLFVDYVLD